MKTKLALTLLGGIALAMAPVTHAALINVNFIASNGPFADETQTGLFGVVGGGTDTWNQITTSGAALLDSSGAGTLVGVSGLPTTGWGISRPLSLLTASRSQFNKGVDSSMTITGLTPSSLHNVYLYSHNGNNAATEMSFGTWSTTNATTSPSSQLIDARSNNNGSTFEEGINYVLFENVVADINGQIAFLGDPDSAHRLYMNGFQIMQVPEPSTTLLVGLGGLLVFVRRRR